MGQYLLKKTIQKHHDSINALAFSPDGSLFASGADDGLIIIFLGNGSGREVRRFQVKAPVTILLWRSRFGHTLLAGDAAGDVHTISLNGTASVSVSTSDSVQPSVLNVLLSVSFTGKPILSYHQLCAWPRSLHRGERHLASCWLGKGRSVGEASNDRCVFAVSWLPGNCANPNTLQLLGNVPVFFQTLSSSQS